jgi:hypothetical protein
MGIVINSNSKNKRTMKQYIDIKHLLIRLAILIGVPAITMILFFGYLIPKKYETETRHVDYGLGVMIFVFMEIFLLGAMFFAETIWLHFKKKTQKRNANLLIASLAMAIFFTFYIFAYYGFFASIGILIIITAIITFCFIKLKK